MLRIEQDISPRIDVGRLTVLDTSVDGVHTEDMDETDFSAAAMSDQTMWLLAVRDGRDRAAFGKLFDYYAPRLKAMMMRGGNPDGVAEDIVQDVMLTVWRKADQFDPQRAEASAWIYRIGRNRQIDLTRRRRPAVPDVLEDIPGSEPDAAQILGMSQEAQHLRNALNRLKPEQTKMIEKAYLGELSHAEISRETGLPIGTVKSRIRLALDRLRHELKDLRRE